MFCTYSNCIMPFWTSMRSELRHFFIVNWKAFRAKSLPPVQSDWWKRYLQTRCIKQAYTQIRSAKCESHTRENSYYNFTCKTQVQQEYCEFSWLAVSVGWKGMIFPLQASIGPALWHNDPEKEGVDSLIRQEAMGYYQKNLRLKPWGLTCPSFQGIPKFVPERVKDGGEPSIRCISAWGVEMIKFKVILSFHLFISSLQIMCSTVNQRCALNVSPSNPYLHASRSQGTWKAFIFHRMGHRRRLGKCNCAMAEGGQWSMIQQSFFAWHPTFEASGVWAVSKLERWWDLTDSNFTSYLTIVFVRLLPKIIRETFVTIHGYFPET